MINSNCFLADTTWKFDLSWFCFVRHWRGWEGGGLYDITQQGVQLEVNHDFPYSLIGKQQTKYQSSNRWQISLVQSTKAKTDGTPVEMRSRGGSIIKYANAMCGLCNMDERVTRLIHPQTGWAELCHLNLCDAWKSQWRHDSYCPQNYLKRSILLC